jgi:hypothetical protein
MSKHNHIFVRPARPSDSEKFVRLSVSTPNNLFDPSAASYPTSFTLAAYNKEKTILFAPIQTPFMMESLAIDKDNTSELEVANALKTVVQTLVTQASIKGVGEIYFCCKDETTKAFAERQCFERMPFQFYRLKISDLEPDGEK